MNTTLFLVLIFVFIFLKVKADKDEKFGCGRPNTSELVGKTYIPIKNCVVGKSYESSGTPGKCTCWYQDGRQCGYICDRNTAAIPKSKLESIRQLVSFESVHSRVRRQTTCPPNPLPANQLWNPSPRCPVGGVYSTSTHTCACCGMLGYLCTLKLTACPSNPLPPNVESFIPEQGCTTTGGSATDIVITDTQKACICSKPVQCGLYCYDIKKMIQVAG